MGFLPSELAISSPERINPSNLRDEHSGLVRVVRTLGGGRTVLSPPHVFDREHLAQE